MKFVRFAYLALLAALGLLSSSCMKVPSLEYDFGPEASQESVNEALQSAPVRTAASIGVGEFSYREGTTALESLPPQVTRQVADTITKKVDCETERTTTNGCLRPGERIYILTQVRETRELQDGQMKPSKEEIRYELQKPPLPSPPALAKLLEERVRRSFFANSANVFAKANNPLGLLGGKLQGFSSPDSEIRPFRRTTYHKLRTKDFAVPVPILVRLREGCGGLGELCDQPLRVREVAFDIVSWPESDRESPERTSAQFWISPDAPFFASELMRCFAGSIPYERTRIGVRQCEEVKDFVCVPRTLPVASPPPDEQTPTPPPPEGKTSVPICQ